MQLPRRPRLVVDSNVWVSFMLTRSFSRLPEIIRTGRAIPLISSEALSELEDVLARPKFRKQITAERTARFMAFLQLSGTMVEPEVEIKACRDPKDDHLLALAVAGQADIFVTGDSDLLSMDPFQKIRIIGPSEFLRSFK